MALPRRSMLQHWSHCNTSLFKPIKYPTTIYISTRYMHSLWRPLVLDAMLSKPRQAMPFGSCRLYKKRFYSSDTKMASTIQLPDTHMADAEQQFSSTTSIESSDLSLSPVSLLVNLMDTIHATPLIAFELYSGTPWWLVIVGTTIFLRTMCTLPLAIQNKQRTDRLRKLQPVLMAWESTLGLQLKHGHRTGNLQQDKNYKKMYKQKTSQLYKEYRCNPLYTFILPWVQIPLFISMSFALRWLAAFPVIWLGTPSSFAAGMDVEGTLWFDDLTVADPTMITPIIIGTMHLINIELNSTLRSNPNTQRTSGQIAFRMFMRSFAILMIPISAYVPMVRA
ncbi:hypothetical protein QVD99_006996 [Batrachochytrium dendrobatidis]|nr:hypothetical protein QVD99_006996 [Batrachochytrium dendrobatidis]